MSALKDPPNYIDNLLEVLLVNVSMRVEDSNQPAESEHDENSSTSDRFSFGGRR
jgi:hypothetical protein